MLFLPPSDAYVRSFLYLLYTLIKLYYTKALSDQASSLAPDWILLLWGPRIPVSSCDSTTNFHLGGSSRILQDKVRILRALVLCSHSEHVFCCALLTLRCACVNEWHALRFHSDLIRLMAETCRGVIPTCQCQETPNVSLRNRPEMGKACGPNFPFSVKLFGLFDHFITPLGIRSTNLIYRIIDFQETCDLYCYCILWLRSQTWIGSQESV